MLGCIEAVLASAEKATERARVQAFAILLEAVRFPAFAAFTDLLNLNSKTKTLMRLYFILSLLLVLEASRIPRQSRDHRLLMALLILITVPTVIAFTVLSTVELPLEALAIEL